MSTGERTFSTAGRQVNSGFEPFQAGNYALTLKQVEVRQAQGAGKVPYVAATFEAEGTALREGGKNRNLFHNFLLSLKPGKDGVVNLDRAGGLVAFARAVEVELSEVAVMTREADVDGTIETLEFLNPQEVKAWLTELVGVVVQAKVKVRKDPQYGDKNEVDRFLPKPE
jgi:hypothetical protein